MRALPFTKIVSLLGLGLLSACAGPSIGTDLDESSEPLTGSCPTPADPFAGPVQGIDISAYQTVTNWGQVAANKSFVIIKATEANFANSAYAKHRAGAEGTGLKVGFYHYLRFDYSAKAQSDAFINTVGNDPGDLPPMLDIEDSAHAGQNSAAKNIQIVQDWLDAVEAKYKKKPFIYTGGGFWGGANFGNPAQFQSYDFCWARYSASNTCPQVPDNLVSRIKMWQYRADAFPGIPAGSVPGISGAVDLDVFYGDKAAFAAFLGQSAPEYQAKYSKQSYPLAADGAVTVKVGSSVKGYIEMTNVGTATWKPGTVFLAPIPRDKASPYHAPSWSSGTRVSTVEKDTPPGQVGHFALDIGAAAPGDGSLKLGWVAEGITWFADGPKGGGPADGIAEVKVHAIPNDDPGAGGAAGAGAGGGSAGGGSAGGGNAGAAGAGAAGAPSGHGGAAGAKAGNGGGGAAGSTGPDETPQYVDLKNESDGGCGCQVVGARPTLAAAWAIGLGLAAASRRRRRSTDSTQRPR